MASNENGGDYAIEELESVRRTLLAQLSLGKGLLEQDAKEVFAFNGITHWEDLDCVGFDPETSRLSAVVSINQETGYSGNLCTDGSREWVRFWIDWQDGTGWHDVGLTGFRAHDISDAPPGPQHPIEHLVYVRLDDDARRRCCETEVLPRVRAVLAWNQVPPLDPNFVPYFGTRRDASIQIEPRTGWFCLLDKLDLKIAAQLDTSVPLPTKPPAPVPLPELAARYRELADRDERAEVPDHRLVYQVAQPLLAGKAPAAFADLATEVPQLAELGIDFGSVLELLSKPLDDEAANTSYEELTCVGLNTAQDLLGAVVRIKRPTGYGGDLCEAGSREYVAFWADWNNDGTFDDHLGTVALEVHDIANIPRDDLHYAVFLPIDVKDRLRDCVNPNIVRIRAVLSWATPPSSTDPDALNFWGNRIDRLVRLRHTRVPGTTLTDLIYSIGNVDVADIDPATSLAHPPSGILNPNVCAPALTYRPWGGRIDVRGRFYNSGPAGTVRYQIQVKKATEPVTAFQPATYAGNFTFKDVTVPWPHNVYVSQSPADGWFEYLEDTTVTFPIYEATAYLGSWQSAGQPDEEYDLRLAYTTDYGTPQPWTIHYSTVIRITTDNTDFVVSPTANPAVDLSSTLDLVIDGGDCHQYSPGDVIQGHLRAVDDHFFRWSLDLQPSTHTNGITASPSCRSYASLLDTGDGNAAWQIQTQQGANELDKCGYTLTLRAWDRTIRNSNGSSTFHGSKAVGFSIA